MGEVVFGHYFEGLLEDLPELDCLVIRREQVVGRILPPAPLDLVDLLLDLERLEVVKFRFMRLELGVELVFARFFLSQRVSDIKQAVFRAEYWVAAFTVSFRSNSTTRPPLSPVAR